MTTTATPDLEPITRLTRDLRQASAALSPREVRYLVDAYYQVQEYRKAAGNQVRALQEGGEPASVLAWLRDQMEGLEGQIRRAMDAWTDEDPVARWAKSNVGIGPVLAAGLMAHIDFAGARTVGQVWRFAGLDPTAAWEKGKKRPWNAQLKTLCWKVGDSFVKFSGHPRCVYGQLYRQRKEQEVERNEAGAYAEQAAATLAQKRIGDAATRRWYEAGKLPPGRLDLRARRWAVKLFLSHLHQVWWETHRGGAPVPFAVAHLGHVDVIPVPNWPMED